MYLYTYEGFQKGRDKKIKTEDLINAAVDRFEAEYNISFEEMSREICRTEKGKPYFRDIPIEFSVSHTDDLWVCLISEGKDPVGVDIQIIKKARRERIMEWYFTEDEKKYVSDKGEEGFFQIWARKEAYAKYTGKGLNKNLKEISTIKNDEVKYIDFDIRAGVKGSCCVKEKEELCIRMI